MIVYDLDPYLCTLIAILHKRVDALATGDRDNLREAHGHIEKRSLLIRMVSSLSIRELDTV